MRILYHHRTQAQDAQGVHIREMVKAFRDLGHEVEVAALLDGSGRGAVTGRGWLLGTLRRLPPWVYEMMTLTYNMYGYRRLSQAIRRQRPDLIYERYALNTFCGIWASRRHGVPLILEVNAPLSYEQADLGELTFRRLARVSERWICSHSTRTLVVSRAMKHFLLREGVPDAQVVVMPNGVDPTVFHPGVSGRGVRERFGLGDAPVIGFVGWFRRWHGLEMLLDVTSRAGLARRGVRLLLVGDGPAYQDLRRRAEMHDLPSAVVFTGAVSRENVPAHIAAMDIAVLPSATGYACPMKILEYMALGKCVIAPDQPNVRELLEHGTTGLLFKAGDPDSLQAALLATLDNPAQRETMGRQARQSILDRCLFWHANARRALRLAYPGSAPDGDRGSTDAREIARPASLPTL